MTFRQMQYQGLWRSAARCPSDGPLA